MYLVKTLKSDEAGNRVLEMIISTMHEKSEKEKEHSINVSNYCQIMGRTLGLPDAEVCRLRDAGYLHDIGKIVLDENQLNEDIHMDKDLNEFKKHSMIGFRILKSFGDKADLAQAVLSHHENWDGSGYPKGKRKKFLCSRGLSQLLKVMMSY
jgi:putative nucleotidyltransferase with HDIG domain